MGAEHLKPPHDTLETPITQRQAVSRTQVGGWLDRILVASSTIRPGASIEDAAAALVAAVASALPTAAVGVCLAASDGGQAILRRSPKPGYGESHDPTRLFPQYATERVVPVEADEGTTLHVATDDAHSFEEGGELYGLTDRLSLALASALRHARAYDHARERTDEVRGLEAQVIQSEKLASLGQIAAGIVHELNNPLTSIVAYSDYLRKKAIKAGGDAGDIERLLRINEAAERILRFARDLVAYSRPSAEVPAPVVLHDIIERALVFCEHVVDESRVEVVRSLEASRLVRGVGGQLTQVFVNLFTNACHAMREGGGTLAVATAMAHDGETVIVTIADDGHGIEEEHLPRIFDPFFTTKADGGGTGLGLSIVRNIVASHGGTIRAHRHAPRGTVFVIELPAAAAPDSGR